MIAVQASLRSRIRVRDRLHASLCDRITASTRSLCDSCSVLFTRVIYSVNSPTLSTRVATLCRGRYLCCVTLDRALAGLTALRYLPFSITLSNPVPEHLVPVIWWAACRTVLSVVDNLSCPACSSSPLPACKTVLWVVGNLSCLACNSSLSLLLDL